LYLAGLRETVHDSVQAGGVNAELLRDLRDGDARVLAHEGQHLLLALAGCGRRPPPHRSTRPAAGFR
jgi:hypothetical protein